MGKITYNAELLKIMALFEKITRAKLKDCFYDDNDLLTFIVPDYQLGKAIGKKAANIKRLEQMFKKKIKVVGFNENPAKFAQNLIYPMKADSNVDNNVIVLKTSDSKTKGFLIGRNKSNIKNNLSIIRKYFKEINDLKIE